MDAFSDFEKIVDIPDLKQPPTTTRKIDSQVLVDEDMKKKWHMAKDLKERIAAILAVNEMVLHGLKQVIDSATSDLVPLTEQYSRLSLAGSCSAQVRGEIKCLEAMERTASPRHKEEVWKRLCHKRRQLKLLNSVEEDALKGVQG